MENQVRAHVLISGRVQGVNFRVSTRNQAREAGVTGWVRNMEDGRVEAVFEGTNAAVRRVVSWCYSGPTAAEVERVELTWEDPRGDEGAFSISY